MQLQPSDPDIQTIVGRIRSGDLDLQPEFQRGEVWPLAKKRRLIDSILRKWHVPPIHVVVDEDEPIELTAKEVEAISFMAKKQYTTIKIFEIDEFEDEHILPFVQVNDGTFEYDTRTMSLGEISVLLFFWTLRRAEPGAIFLAEEPETYISPSSQAALMDYLASACVTKKMFVVITTHSPQMVASLNEDQVKFVFRTPLGSRLAAPEQHLRMRRMVGLELPVKIIIGVEDRAAREFTRLLVARADHSLSLRTEITDVGSVADLTNLRRLFPRRVRALALIAAYDGDARGNVNAAVDEWPLVFLPGESAIENVFRALGQENLALFAEKLGRGQPDIEIALASLEGIDHHDWFEDLAQTLALSFDQLMMACFEYWYSFEDNRTAAQRFVDEVNSAAGL